MILLVKESTVVRETVQLLMEHRTYETDGTVINCTDNTGEVRCKRGPGSVTLYTKYGCCGGAPYPNGIYTCCIEGSCISIKVYQDDDLVALIPNS